MKNLICIDTNILIRFLRADDKKLSAKAKEIFSKASEGKIKIYLDEVIVAEIIWLLSSFYKQKRIKIASQLQELISQDWIVNPRKKLILAALSIYSNTNLHYVDSWLWWVNNSIGGKLATFDKDLQKQK